MDKNSLNKLAKIVSDISKLEENKWFTKKLLLELTPDNSSTLSSYQLSEIYEYCLRQILNEQAKNFYKDFILLDIKPQLVKDFIRMEKFRRDDNFEEFCLALFQQVELIINSLISEDLKIHIQSELFESINQTKSPLTGELKFKKSLKDVIFDYRITPVDLDKKFKTTMSKWFFIEKYNAVLYYYYFKKNISNFTYFSNISDLGNNVYLILNLNHRGGTGSPTQETTKQLILNNSPRYYYKFLGLLEDFSSTINKNIKNHATLSQINPTPPPPIRLR